MNKQEFLTQLRKELSVLPQKDIEEYLTFYTEMIEDRIEEGLSEEEAVSAVGSLEEIVKQIVSDTSLIKIAKERIKQKRQIKAWEIVLLILGSPIWLSLCLAVFAVILSLYISLWAVIISLWAIFASVVACSISGILSCIVFTLSGNSVSGFAILSAGIVCAGLSIFMFYGCKTATNGILILTKKIAIWIKNCFIKKEKA